MIKTQFELIAALATTGASKADSYWPGELRSILKQLTDALDEAYKSNPDKLPV